MGIENELVQYLERKIKDGTNKARDIDIVKFYYGLNDSPWPTLEETANRFGVGTRERIRQLLNAKFRNNVRKSDIPSLEGFLELIQSRKYWNYSEFEDEVFSAGLVNLGTHIKGIFNLLEDVGFECDYEIFTPDLERATRGSMLTSKNIFLLNKSELIDISRLLKIAQGLPGRCGIANLKYIESELGEYYEIISNLIESSPTSWVNRIGGDYWYIFENRDNTIINYSEKVFLAVDVCNTRRLASIYRNALDGRTNKYPYPPVEIIEDYLRSSVFFINDGDDLKFIGETTKLNDIEEDIVAFFESRSTVSFPQLDQYLTGKGYGRPYILKNTNFSPLVFVDKSKGRKHYEFSLIGKRVSLHDKENDETGYESYLRRLRALLDTGTDETREQKTRKEQYILQEWLFKDKIHECCAICGREFSVKSLVAAHKKPRSNCNDAERLDPYIVMPLCLMGCDYLYENMYIFIQGGEIKRGIVFDTAKSESKFIEELVGRKIDYKWLSGNESYFRSPS